MHIDRIYPSRWIKASDLDGRELKARIKRLTFEELDAQTGKGPEEKPVLWFEKTEKGLVLNATNGRAIAEAYGAETDGWPGHQVTLYGTMVEAFGKTQEVVRIKVTPENRRGTLTLAPEPEPAPEADFPDDDDQDLPF